MHHQWDSKLNAGSFARAKETMNLVDASHRLGLTMETVIDTREKLFSTLKEYLERLFEGKDDDMKLFWATYSVFIIKKDRICLCSRMGTGYPIFDVDVRKSNQTSIMVKPYKIDDYKKYEQRKLKVTMNPEEDGQRDRYKMILPLEVMGWKEDLKQHWEGKIWVRSNFTGWNIIEVSVNKERLLDCS